MQVVVAGNGQEALDLLDSRGPFDGVLMDCQMPVMDGYTATQRLRGRHDWQHLPVIAMTASALAEDRERALASGMNAHITKPIDVERMLATMAEWIVPSEDRVVDSVPAELSDWPPPLADGHGIDTADGLARCMGKHDLYRRVLRGFRTSNARFAVELRKALAASHWDDARRAAHDLRGLAGTIGARTLQESAAALHDAVTARERETALAQLTVVDRHLEGVLQEIDDLVPAP
jgi:CheY-like chemotaxis protein